jgi:hypothetical protein
VRNESLILKPTTMSKAEQAANDLIEKYLMFTPKILKDSVRFEIAVFGAVQDNQNTIDALEAIPDLKVVGNILLDIIEHYQAIKTILKSKLK